MNTGHDEREKALCKQRATKHRTSRGAVRAHLPRIEVMLTPDYTTCPCCRESIDLSMQRAYQDRRWPSDQPPKNSSK